MLLGVVSMRLKERMASLALSIVGGLLVSQNIGYMFNLVDNFYGMFERLRSGQALHESIYFSVVVAVVIAAGSMTLKCNKKKENKESSEKEELLNDLPLDN